MSQLLSYFRNLFHPIGDRKRRRTEPENGPHIPKYRRVSSIFPRQYNHRIDDEVDHYQEVKRNRQNYNEILENFLMEQQSQQRKQFKEINDDEFSDEDDIARVPSTSAQRPSASGYSFNSYSQQQQQQQPSSSSSSTRAFKFGLQKFENSNRHDDDLQFMPKKTMSRPKPIPELVPISSSVQSHLGTNGFGNVAPPSSRRSVFDFTRKNRAFNDSTTGFKPSASILDRTHNLEVKNKYDNLLKSLIPRFAQKSQHHKYSAQKKTANEPIVTVDLSSDETELGSPVAVAYPQRSIQNQFESIFQKPTTNFKKPSPSPFLDISDDDSDTPSYLGRAPVMSSTLMPIKKSEASNESHIKMGASLSSIVPDVKPVNSLKERHQSRTCLRDNAIDDICQKYNESKKKNDKEIEDARLAISKLTTETAEQEKLQQRRIDDTVTSLKQCIIIDEEEEKIDEFPQLTDQQLNIVRFGLYGNKTEVVMSKFNINITRNDLTTLDGLNWLNDEVINFYMELLKERSQEVEHLPKVHVMNTFFIPRLLQTGYSAVKRWTRKIDIFSYDIIPIPVHVGGVHWCMSVINMRDKIIRYYDSMGHPNMPVLDALEQYLKAESQDKRNTPFDTSDWTIENVRDCPQQRNGSDCGVFSCMFAEFICRDSKISFDQQHMQYFRRKMVLEIITGRLLLGY